MLKRIIIHWTAGTGQPNNTDYQHYHYLVNKDGVIVEGKHRPQDNENCTDGVYAAHCGGGNTGSIGISMCGMNGYVAGEPLSTNYPLTAIQCEACWKKIAELCKLYGIKVTPQTVLTHYEFGQTHPKTTSYGKIDIIYLPPYPWIQKDKIGDFIRTKVRWYLARI